MVSLLLYMNKGGEKSGKFTRLCIFFVLRTLRQIKCSTNENVNGDCPNAGRAVGTRQERKLRFLVLGRLSCRTGFLLALPKRNKRLVFFISIEAYG